jgi:hypothetical protein
MHRNQYLSYNKLNIAAAFQSTFKIYLREIITYPANKIDQLKYTVSMKGWSSDTQFIQNTPKGPGDKIHKTF